MVHTLKKILGGGILAVLAEVAVVELICHYRKDNDDAYIFVTGCFQQF